MARYDDLDTKTIGLSAVVSSVILLILILAGRALSYGWANAYEESRTSVARYRASENEISSQKSVLDGFAKFEEEPEEEGQEPTTRIVIPVDRAFGLVAQELSGKPQT